MPQRTSTVRLPAEALRARADRPPSVNKHLVMQLARCEYVDRRESVSAGTFAGQSGRTESLNTYARVVQFCSATCPKIAPPLTLGCQQV